MSKQVSRPAGTVMPGGQRLMFVRPLRLTCAVGRRRPPPKEVCERESVLETSLSIVLPVRNAETTLASQVDHALELAGELTHRFELLIYDDASADNTAEVAAELARRYPQVCWRHNDRRLGRAQTIKAAMQQTSGDVVFIYDPAFPLSAGQWRRLWALRNDPQVVIAQAEAARPRPISAGLLERLSSWGESLRRSVQRSGQEGGVQMIRRQGVAELAQSESPERELRLDRVDGAECVSRGSAVARPSFLSRLKRFAAAE